MHKTQTQRAETKQFVFCVFIACEGENGRKSSKSRKREKNANVTLPAQFYNLQSANSQVSLLTCYCPNLFCAKILKKRKTMKKY